MNRVKDWFKRWANYQPDKIMLKEFETGKTCTALELHDLAETMKVFFCAEMGLKRGDVLAVLSENNIDYTALLGLAQKTGIIIAPLNYRLAGTEIDLLIEICQPKVLLYDLSFEEKVKQLSISSNSLHLMSWVELSEKLEHKTNSLEGYMLDDNANGEALEEDPLFIIFTSGTTGVPKGCIYTHKMLHFNSLNTALRLDLTSMDRTINCAPPFHTGGWNVLLSPFLHHGAFTLLMKSFDPELILQQLEKEACTIWWAVPTMLKMMKDAPSFESSNLSKIRYFIVGGEAMPLPLINIWDKKGIPIRQGYGLTEVGPNVTSLNEEDAIKKIGSIGKPNFYLDIKIVDESGKCISGEGSGELWLGGPCVSPGYWQTDKQTSSAFDGFWFKTGDVVKRDEQGYLYVVDRIKNMYISGGENVYPAQIEKVLRTHTAIEDVAIIGVKDEKWGEVGKAFIQLKQNITCSENEIWDFCEQRLAKYKIPKYITWMSNLPKNDAGKIDKKALKKLEE